MNKIKEIVAKSNPAIDWLDMETLLRLVIPFKPKVVIDIGTHSGGSVKAWTRAFNPELLITMDSGRPPVNVSIVKRKSHHYLWDTPSNSKETISKVKKILNERKVDFLFIDGGHGLEEIGFDIVHYSKLVKKGGVVALHDIAVSSENCYVRDVWEEIRGNFNYAEFRLGEKSTGIGVLFL